MIKERSPSVLVLVAGVRFSRIEQTMASLGWTGGPVTVLAPLLPGEPEMARWERGDAETTYSFDPVCHFRCLTVTGDTMAAESLRERLVCVTPEDVKRLVCSADDEAVMRGLLSADALMLQQVAPTVERLATHPRPVISRLARTVSARLAVGDQRRG